MLYSRHLWLYQQYATALLRLYERHCPGFCVILTLVAVKQDIHRLHNLSTGFRYDHDDICLRISPIIHRQRWDPNEPKLIDIDIPSRLLDSGVHPLLASILTPQIPQIWLETAVSCLRYIQSGGHSVKTRKSLKPLLKSGYFTRLKMRPWVSRFRKRQYHHPSGDRGIDKQDLCSAWWGYDPHRPTTNDFLVSKRRLPVPFRSFSYRPEYVSNYDLWCTYRYALLLLPILLTESPPDSQLTSIAADCIFNSFCTAYPRETRKAKQSITRYLSIST